MMAISDNSKALFFISSMSELVFVVFDHPVTTNKIEQSLLFRHLRFHQLVKLVQGKNNKHQQN
jgi:hypothetical protein